MKKGSIKNNRINQEVLRELTSIIRSEVKDPRIDPLMVITRAEVTADLGYCRVHISTLDTGKTLERCLEGLESSKGYIRKRLAAGINLRKTPELVFVPDRSMEYAAEMSKKIEALAKAGGTGNDEESYS